MLSVRRFPNEIAQLVADLKPLDELATPLVELRTRCSSAGRACIISTADTPRISGCMMSVFRFGAPLTISSNIAGMVCGREMSSISERSLAAFARFLMTSKCSKRCTVTRVMRNSERLKAILIKERGTGLRAPERSRCIQSLGSLER